MKPFIGTTGNKSKGLGRPKPHCKTCTCNNGYTPATPAHPATMIGRTHKEGTKP